MITGNEPSMELTKREFFAIELAKAAHIANPEVLSFADWAVNEADRLLEALERERDE